jgi:predicted transposase/invertase (TIGR01784 family)
MKEREETDWENYVNSRVTKAVDKAVTKAVAKATVKAAAEATAKATVEATAKATAETKAETAAKLLNVGMDKKMISEVTGLSLEEIQKLDKHE